MQSFSLFKILKIIHYIFTNSTLLFLALPFGVALSAIGSLSPLPRICIRLPAIGKLSLKYSFMACALFLESN
jgi:hypothetical protein